eukprot:scaffold9295_cov122-Isochrysis_galbana.AAC.8
MSRPRQRSRQRTRARTRSTEDVVRVIRPGLVVEPFVIGGRPPALVHLLPAARPRSMRSAPRRRAGVERALSQPAVHLLVLLVPAHGVGAGDEHDQHGAVAARLAEYADTIHASTPYSPAALFRVRQSSMARMFRQVWR